MSNQQNKLQKERNHKLLLELASLPGNNICADCKARLPRWASHSLGIFICMNCASIHRKIGTHITKVKSLTMDDWSKEQLEFMKSMGNIKSNSIYNPNELRHPPPPNLEDTERDSEIEQYIRSKYEYRKFLDKSALVASKLGPSRSASSLTPRSVSSPLTNKSQPPASSRAPVTATDAAASTPITSRMPSSASTNPLPQFPSSNSAYSQNQTRSVSQPIPSQGQQQQQNSMSRLGSVWEDLNSLTSPGQNSSLPLQYQTTSSFSPTVQQTPHVNGAMGQNGYPVGVTSAGMGMNPFQPQILGQNPFSQQQSQSAFSPPPLGSFTSPPTIGIPTNQPQSYGQQYFGSTPSSTPLMSQSTSAPYFQPQPQSQASLQVQTPPNQGFMSSSASQPFMSTPSSQSQFLSPSPSQQFLSHSPQPQMQMQQPQSAAQGQFLYQSPVSTQAPMQFGMGAADTTGQSQFLGMTTMQMQQQLLLQQQQQQQQQQQLLQQQQQQQQHQQQILQHQQQQQQLPQAMFSPNQPQTTYGQMFSPGGYPTQGGQWGSM